MAIEIGVDSGNVVAPSARAGRRWAQRERQAEKPWPCSFCRRNFRTERGARQHLPHCPYNPEARMFTSGAYDPLMRNGRIVGYIWNGRSEQERQRVHAGFADVSAALGNDGVYVGPSQRTVVIGPDPTEPCARCPEPRAAHKEAGCSLPGCSCASFVGASA